MSKLQQLEMTTKEPKIGDKLQFPDGDIATIIKIKEHFDEEDDKGFYDAKEVIYTIDGDSDLLGQWHQQDDRDGDDAIVNGLFCYDFFDCTGILFFGICGRD